MSELNYDETIEQSNKEIKQASLKLELLELLIKIEEAHSKYTDIVNKKKNTVDAST